jgi:hypothetical protein
VSTRSQIEVMSAHANSWTIADLKDELTRFEAEARQAGLAEESVRTYVGRSRNFVRWLAGEFQSQGPRR